MQLVGVADVAPTLSIKALKERGMPYNLYNALADNQKLFDDAGIPVSGTLEELVDECDILLDATSAGVGAKTESFMKIWQEGCISGGERMMWQMFSSMDMPTMRKVWANSF